MKQIIVALFSILLISCSGRGDTKTMTGDLKADVQNDEPNRSNDLVPEPDIDQRLQGQKAIIDSAISKKQLKVEVLVKEPDKNNLTVVKDQNWPEIIEITYNLWRDEDDEIVLIGEYPFSESGDWSIGYEHYFDAGQKTFAFERNTNFFNSVCTDGVAYERIIEFYDSDFNRIDRLYNLTDEQGEELQKDSCVMNYDYPYDVSKGLKEYLKRINYGS